MVEKQVFTTNICDLEVEYTQLEIEHNIFAPENGRRSEGNMEGDSSIRNWSKREHVLCLQALDRDGDGRLGEAHTHTRTHTHTHTHTHIHTHTTHK